ncbi:MAG TPA: lipocalin-like domain-containing protein [Candidatus Acidoferrum sp.]|nr:lipocalin-like domain-containing protein [Candidatus Acidoferrum sp.]
MLKNDRRRPSGLLPTDDEKLALYDSMFAYSGVYTVNPDRVVHHLDMSWNEAWSGTEQVRFCKLEGNILTFISAPAKSPLDGREVVHEVIFERATGDEE